ncbi:MAG: PAS domain-containing protein [Symploca sp. SIO2B6]|nr:PAS domain-containing protein [Symploca sp. SIO2B6]
MKLPFWTGGLVTATIAVLIESLHQSGVVVPTPFLLLNVAVVMSASIGGLKAGMVSATVWVIYIIYAVLVPFSPLTLTRGVLQVSFSILIGFLPALHLGWTKDRSASLTKVVQQTRQKLEKRVSERTAELLTINAQLKEEINDRIRVQEALQENEKALQLSQQRLESILSYLEDVVWSFSPQTNKLLYLNSAVEKVYGRQIHEFLNNFNLWQEVIHPEDQQRVEQANLSLSKIGSQDLEYRILRPNGEVRWLRERTKLIFDTQGNLIRRDSLANDITEHKQAEAAKIEAQKKEILLKEIHHRVKNNLQIVSGLLYLQSRYVEDQATLQVLQESRERVQTMALIHEKLYRSKNIDSVDLKDYIGSLTQSLFESYAVKAEAISLVINIEPIFLEIDMAIPCGLIINELVSNALKHAFPEKKTGEVAVEFHKTENNLFELVVRDSGIGIAEDIDFQTQKSLGMRLVRSLATRQLKGNVELDTSIGTSFKISFR